MMVRGRACRYFVFFAEKAIEKKQMQG